MEAVYKNTLERLDSKKAELLERQEQFEVMWHNEKNSQCFERNAINDLMVMLQLKAEIRELEHNEILLRVQLGN